MASPSGRESSGIPHDYNRRGEVMCVPMPEGIPSGSHPTGQLGALATEGREDRGCQGRPSAAAVGWGPRGFAKLFELAEALRRRGGRHRPRGLRRLLLFFLVGQAGKQVKPQIPFSFGISGTVRRPASCNGAKFTHCREQESQRDDDEDGRRRRRVSSARRSSRSWRAPDPLIAPGGRRFPASHRGMSTNSSSVSPAIRTPGSCRG